MKMWPFGNKLETRQESSYSDVLIAALVSRAQGKTLSIPTATSALEACAGLTGRALHPPRCPVRTPSSKH